MENHHTCTVIAITGRKSVSCISEVKCTVTTIKSLLLIYISAVKLPYISCFKCMKFNSLKDESCYIFFESIMLFKPDKVVVNGGGFKM